MKLELPTDVSVDKMEIEVGEIEAILQGYPMQLPPWPEATFQLKDGRTLYLRSMTLLGFPQASLFSGTLSGDGKWCETPLFTFPVRANDVSAAQKAVTVGVRPQDVRLDVGTDNGWLTRPAQVTLTEDLGGELVVYLEADGLPLVSVVRHEDAHLLSNDVVTIGVKPESLVLFAPDSGQCVGLGAG